MSAILTLNAGSSSLKFSVYETGDDPDELCCGQVENIGSEARLVIDTEPSNSRNIGAADHNTAVTTILEALNPILGDRTVEGVGHRIVHGGLEFKSATVLTPDIIERLTALEPLAPLHQPHNLAAVNAAQEAFPKAVQVGCFDTAFHRGHPWVNDTFALPRKLYDEGVRRYGFHGLSYEYVTGRLHDTLPELDRNKVVIAHLGNGASMCAVREGKSIGSTMGFSALDGLPMGTRCGQLDPGVLLYLMERGMSATELTKMLYEESGMKGLSGLTSDMRTLLASDKPEAREAIDYYVFRIRREVGAMSAILGGLDALVFCGGIGENSPEIRARVLGGLEYLGLHLDEKANAKNALHIGGDNETLCLVIPTDEERVIARAVQNAIRKG